MSEDYEDYKEFNTSLDESNILKKIHIKRFKGNVTIEALKSLLLENGEPCIVHDTSKQTSYLIIGGYASNSEVQNNTVFVSDCLFNNLSTSLRLRKGNSNVSGEKNTDYVIYDDLNSSKMVISTVASGTGLANPCFLKFYTEDTKTISANDWEEWNGYGNFKFRHLISISGCTSSMHPLVTFAFASQAAAEGVLSSICESVNGGVYVYATKKISGTVDINNVTVIGKA